MKSEKFKAGRYVGETNEYFEEGKIYRGKFVVFETVIFVYSHQRVMRCQPELWLFKEEWKVD